MHYILRSGPKDRVSKDAKRERQADLAFQRGVQSNVSDHDAAARARQSRLDAQPF
jgi:hypothetical protein